MIRILLFTLLSRAKRLSYILLAFGISLFCGISLLTFNSQDPSFNRASNNEVMNLAGELGAGFADPLLQFIGLASALLAIIPLCWGCLLIKQRTLPKWWLRFGMFFLAIISAASLCAFISPPEIWPFSSLGGFIGHYINSILLTYLPHYAIISINIGVFCFALYVSLGISMNEWANLLHTVLYTTSWIVSHMIAIISWLASLRFQNKIGDPSNEVTPPLAELKRKPTLKRRKPSKPTQTSLQLNDSYFNLPSLSLLQQGPVKKQSPQSDAALSQNARFLEKVLEDFGITGRIVKVRPGPVVTLYELEPAAGVKSARVIGLADDIARSMSAISIRIAVVPGHNVIGIELPNNERDTVYLRDLLDNLPSKETPNLPLALGKDIGGAPMVVDLAKMPHLLVAGTTGSGKSVSINTMILSLLYQLPPEQCKFIMIDPKMLELSVYEGIPHLLCPVVTEPSKAVVALKWAVKEMEQRYRLMSTLSVRNILSYNKRIQQAINNGETLERTVQTGFDPETGKPIFEKVPLDMSPLPFIVVIVDEMADLMLVAGKDIESSIQRLAQMARAAGIHLIMATQRPSVDVITGVIKANFPTRISFQVTSRIDSRTILGEQGAEQLLGMGDMLYMSGGTKLTRIHGAFVDDKEVEEIVSFLKTQGEPSYLDEVTEAEDNSEIADNDSATEYDPLYDEAVSIVLRDKKASTSYVQRQLKIGYNRAANIIDQMEQEGVISSANHVGKREILVENA